MSRFLAPLGLLLCIGVVSALLTACATTTPVSPELTQCMARPDRFVSSDKGTVLDTCTQLMWMAQDYRNIEGKAPVGRRVAWVWADVMNTQRYAGYNDWRVPSVEEYKTLYIREKSQQSYRGRVVHYPALFASRGGEWYWTSDVHEWGSPPDHVHYGIVFN